MLDAEQRPATRALQRFVPKSPKEMGRLRRRLAVAGYHAAGGRRSSIALAELALPMVLGLTGR